MGLVWKLGWKYTKLNAVTQEDVETAKMTCKTKKLHFFTFHNVLQRSELVVLKMQVLYYRLI